MHGWKRVLIESDWNLKIVGLILFLVWKDVLIESDWNLKDYDLPIYADQIMY